MKSVTYRERSLSGDKYFNALLEKAIDSLKKSLFEIKNNELKVEVVDMADLYHSVKRVEYKLYKLTHSKWNKDHDTQ
jgi:hypothetical protein